MREAPRGEGRAVAPLVYLQPVVVGADGNHCTPKHDTSREKRIERPAEREGAELALAIRDKLPQANFCSGDGDFHDSVETDEWSKSRNNVFRRFSTKTNEWRRVRIGWRCSKILGITKKIHGNFYYGT